ncbi:protein SFI1 homolog [Neolamprologus brichardi]|uniref:protein SFI1 homolog n=1 Tax=Neolamprologus brichardi TaxID=32507 RepID=UPI0003EC595D|nr:protein SFI1 homolog [Neolamprologus brichardi]
MQSSGGNSDPVRPRLNYVRSRGEAKQVRKVHIRKVAYRVGYSWNKGGRLKELRIRHLARKFLKIWIQNTFGRVLPHEAKLHYNRVVLRRTFEGWRDEWWSSRREWSLNMRADCHYRYYLCNWTLHSWRMFVCLQREKKMQQQKAQSFADKQRMRLVLDRWEVFTEMRRLKSRMLESALEQYRLSAMHSVWSLWQTRLQHRRDLHILEDQAQKQRALTLKTRAWLQWKEMHTAASCQKEKESRAAFHFISRLKRRALHQWIRYVSYRHTKKETQALAQRACSRLLVRKCWSKWRNALDRKHSEETRLQAAASLATQSIQCRALVRWRAYVALCREETERKNAANQHYQHHLMRAGLRGLSLNVVLNKTYRLNNRMAIQHCQQTMNRKYWKLWQDRVEEAENRSFKPLIEMALSNYSTSLLRRHFHHWREKLAEQRYMQELERRADIWFVDRMLPQCFQSWVEFTLHSRMLQQRRLKAQAYNRRRQCAWVFYTWWGKSDKLKEEMLSERMAVLHDEKCQKQRAWTRWRQRTQERIKEVEKQEASRSLYRRTLLHRTMMQWKENSTELRDRRNREQQACHQGDLRCLRKAVEKWKKFVQVQRAKKSRLEEVQSWHEVKLLKHSFVAWKKHHLQMSQIYDHAEELHKQHTQCFLRVALTEWRENAEQRAVIRLAEQQAQNHFNHSLQLKVFHAWREATTLAVSKRFQQREALSRAQQSINEVRLLQFFRRWRNRTREAQRERIIMEKARRHHKTKLLSNALKAWKEHHYQHQKNKVMKRQGLLLLRLKMYQMYFEQWKTKLQHRQREAKQTERALWHWSLTLQAKVLYGWRIWVTEQRRKQEHAARAALVYRDQLLREGVTCILTYAAHMNDLTTNLTQHSQLQRSQHLQRVVKRCAARWKQRALCKPQREQETRGQPAKKSVSFCLSSVSSSDSTKQEAADGLHSKLTQPQSAVTNIKAAPNSSESSRPTQKNHPASNCRHADEVFVASPHQCSVMSTVPPSESLMSNMDFFQHPQNQEPLLPPSAFMTTGTQNKFKSSLGDTSVEPFPQFVASLDPNSSAYPETHLSASGGETEVPDAENATSDSTSALMSELLRIQQDMKSFQLDRKQLRAWRKLKGVLQSWLQTSGKDEVLEKNAICRELKDLEELIDRLSTKLEKQKPVMLLHAERIQHLQTVLQSLGLHAPHQKTEESETQNSAFPT